MQAKLLLFPSLMVLAVEEEDDTIWGPTMLRVGVVTEAFRCCSCSSRSPCVIRSLLLPSLFTALSEDVVELPSMGDKLRRFTFTFISSPSPSSSSSSMAIRKNLRFLKGSENFLEENGENDDDDSEEREHDRRLRILLPLSPSTSPLVVLQARDTMSEEGILLLSTDTEEGHRCTCSCCDSGETLLAMMMDDGVIRRQI
jgi:hypothetical protein